MRRGYIKRTGLAYHLEVDQVTRPSSNPNSRDQNPTTYESDPVTLFTGSRRIGVEGRLRQREGRSEEPGSLASVKGEGVCGECEQVRGPRLLNPSEGFM